MGLNKKGKFNSKSDIPKADFTMQHEIDVNAGEKDPRAKQYFNDHITTLNKNQKTVFKTIKQAFDNNIGGFYFIDASGGTD